MARWYEGAEESAFKPTAGGYVFQPPNLTWPFGRPRAYLVDAAQKVALVACLRRQRLQILLIMMVFMLIVAGSSVLIAATGTAARLSPAGLAAGFIVVFFVVIAIALLPYFYAVRAMRPLLAGAPRTEERITIGEQFQRLAGAISPKVLWLGGVGGTLMTVGSLMTIGDALSEGRSAFGFPWQISTLVVGALLTSYFIHLGTLRRKARRNA
jgi:hypothetical protein